MPQVPGQLSCPLTGNRGLVTQWGPLLHNCHVYIHKTALYMSVCGIARTTASMNNYMLQ